MRIERADPETYPALVDLIVAREPHTTRGDAGWMFFVPASWPNLVALVARDDDGTVLGVGRLANGAHMPAGWTSIRISVPAAHEGRGVGRALLAALDGTWPADARQLRTFVYDDEPRALEVARHWGFEVEEHSITSRLDLSDPARLPRPAPAAGVTVESVPDYAFPDRDAVEAMLLASQTNPEAGFGAVSTLASLQAGSAGERSVVVVARVDGVPAAIVAGTVAPDDVLHIAYTGVDPAFRGHGLAVLVKQRVHLDAAAAGATVVSTSNEAGNHGIRRINAELGYVVAFGSHRMRRVL